MAIIISSNKKNAVRIDKTQFKNEDELQQYLADNPDIVPLQEIKADIKLLVLAREFNTGSGPIDAVGIDQDGDIYFIETKLYKNSDKRAVVAQVLDYGASAWKDSVNFDDFLARLDEKSRELFKVGAQDKAKDFFNYDEEQLAQLFDQVKINLSSASFKFFILMDELEPRLKDLILFLNQNSQFTVYAVELEYYKHNGLEIVIPKLYGAEVKKDVSSTHGSSAPRLTIEQFWSELEENLIKDQHRIIKPMLDWLIQRSSDVVPGTKSIGIYFKKTGDKSLVACYVNGGTSINFGHLSSDDQREKLRALFKKYLPEISEQPKFQTKLYPSISAGQLVQNAKQLERILEEFLKK